MAKPKTLQTPWYDKTVKALQFAGMGDRTRIPIRTSNNMVAGGAWSRTDNAWHPSRPDFHVPNKALSRIYRAKFPDLMRDAGMSRLIEPGVFRDGWNVNIQPVGAAEPSIRYLSHDVFKVAISDHRIVKAANGTVTFLHKKPRSRRTRYMKLDAEDFMSRFLQHSLPPGQIKPYGLSALDLIFLLQTTPSRSKISSMSSRSAGILFSTTSQTIS